MTLLPFIHTGLFWRRWRRRVRAILALLIGALLLAAPVASADEWIELTDSGFDPAHVTVDAGETLHFSNETGDAWSVTSDSGRFDSKALNPKGAYSMALSVPGTHAYRSTGPQEHTGTITVLARSLPGDDNDRAAVRIPELQFPPVEEEDIAVHPSFGVKASMTRIMLGFDADTTVAEANAALDEANVKIIGGLPSMGMLLVRVPGPYWWNRFAALDDALAALRAAPGVAYAAMSTVVEGTAVPRRPSDVTAGTGSGWSWDSENVYGNAGLRLAQFPASWNLREHIKRKNPSVITGIVDVGFEKHDDLPGLEIQPQVCPPEGCVSIGNSPHKHGNHVAGIIGAAYDNDNDAEPKRSLGVTGTNPFARMYGYSLDSFSGWPTKIAGSKLVDKQLELYDLILRGRPAQLRVINHSIGAATFDGAAWQSAFGTKLCGPGARDDDLPEMRHPMKQMCTPNNLDEWQREMANVGRAAASIVNEAARQGVMIVQAAGNEGRTFCPANQCQPIDAASRGEFAWVARHWDDPLVGGSGLTNPVFVVQSHTSTGAARGDSTFGGDIAAPGGDQKAKEEDPSRGILSTVLGHGYGSEGGSSMAAPHVTGLIGQLLADNPSLSIADVRRLVLGWANGRPAAGGADFTWTMRDRMNRDANGNGMVDYLTTKGLVDPPGYSVELDACDASVSGKPVGSYAWSVDGQSRGSSGECVHRWRPAQEGTYAVTLTVTAVGGEQESVTKQVKVEDLLIVSVGDSIASGEGNPDITSPGSRWQYERCHRSAFGGPAQAARWLESADAKTSVTFLHLACSGARMQGDGFGPGFPGVGGLLTPYEGVTEDDETSACAASGRTDLSVCEAPQLDAAKELVGGRAPDALLVSIGANDMMFSSILTECLKPLNDCSTNDGGRGLFENRIKLLPERYARVAARIRERFPNLPADRVIITQYPDVTTDETGAVNLDCGVASGVSDVEQDWAHSTVIPMLNGAVAAAASAHGWTLAAGIPGEFFRHGYCSKDPWIVDISETGWNQGDKNGAFHPNYAGHSAYAKAIVTSLRDRLGLTTLTPRPAVRDRAPRLNAYRPVAGNGPASRVVDVNDVSKDGNRRVERTVAADGSVTEVDDTKFSHIEDERTAPDGRVDMRDLRRFRDAWLQRCLVVFDGCPPPSQIALDGDDLHVKKDLNFDRCVTGDPDGCGAREHWFSRFDFNGDEVIDPEHKSLVPWREDGAPAAGRADARRMTDLEVLAGSWTGGSGAEGWTKDDVDLDLLRSADLEVHADAVLDAGASKAKVHVREKNGPQVGPTRTLRRRDGFAVMTVPVSNTGQEYEVVAEANTPDGAMSSVSAPFDLNYGEDKFVAVCPDISLKAAPQRVPADGTSTSIVTMTVHKCQGREEVADKDVTFSLEPSGDGTSLEAIAPTTDERGKAQAIFQAGRKTGDYTVKASVVVDDGADPLEAELAIEVVPTIEVRYVWRQTIDDWQESGSTRWQPFNPLQPDCTAPGVDYCIDDFQIALENQQAGGIKRAGTLTGGGEKFALTEHVSDSSASSRSSWTLSFPDGETEDGAKFAGWWVTDPDAYADHPVRGLQAHDETNGIRLSGMQAIGNLPYHYALVGNLTEGTRDPLEVHSAKSDFLLVPPGNGKIRFAAQPDEDVVFQRLEEGFKPFQSCGVLEQDLQTQPGYYISDPSPYIPGALSLGRRPNHTPGDRPMPVGPGRLKVTYAFAAVAAYTGETAPDPVLPDCDVDNPPDADFEFTPANGTVAKEGRQVAFRDRSTDPENDIVERSWDFGDGKTGSGANPHHSFDDDGTYTVTLTVKDAKGNTDTASRDVVVENEPPEADIDDATAPCEQLKVTYRMLDPGAVDKTRLEWKLSSANGRFPTQQGTDHAGVWRLGSFAGLPKGTYPVVLTVTDKDGKSATDDAVVVVTQCGPPPPPEEEEEEEDKPRPTCDPAVSLDAEEHEFLDLVNDYRADNGLVPVEASATLTRAADRHAADMAAKDFMAHTGSDGSSPGNRAWDAGYPLSAGVGENLAETSTAFDALWAWRSSSSGHNENMLNPAWRAIGIARAKGGRWRWATSYGTAQDCPAISEPAATRTAAAADGGDEPAPQPLEPTPSKGGVEIQEDPPPPGSSAPAPTKAWFDGREQESPPTGGAAPPETVSATSEPEPEPDAAPTAGATTDGLLYPPTVAVALAEESPRAGKITNVSNRSRDANGDPIGAVLRFGDTEDEEALELAADETRTHVYPESQWRNWYYLQAKATDADGRVSELERLVDVHPVLPPYLSIRHNNQLAVAGRPYDVAVEAWDQNTGEAIAGLTLTFTLGTQVVTATTDDDGTAKATVKLLDSEGRQEIEIAFAGTDAHRPKTVSHGVHVTINHAPVAKAGGPYLAGEGGSLLLNGTRSADEDPDWFDRIVSYDWDLDGDGDFGDISGRLPRVLEGDELSELVCGGTCVPAQDYPVALRVTDSHGDHGTDTTHVRFVADFDLLLGGETKTIVPGQSNSFAVTVIGSQSYDKPVTLAVTGLPAGVTAQFSKNPVTPTATSVLTLTGGAELENGTFPLRVSATDGTVTKEVGDEVNVAFGLIPICRGTITGVVKDKTTGALVAGSTVSTSAGWTETDSTGRYVFEGVSLGHNNVPATHAVTARKAGFWDASQNGEATCGGVTRVDLEMLDVRTGTVQGRVVDKQTREPLADAYISEHSCAWWGCGWRAVASADDDGRFEGRPTLDPGNRERWWPGRAQAPGYWHQDQGARIAEGETAQVPFELVKQCYGTLKGGRVLYEGTELPAAGAVAKIYISNSWWGPDVTVTADEEGHFQLDRSILLGYNNAPISVRAEPSAPPGAPPGTVGRTDYFQLASCGAEASVTLYLKSPTPNYAVIEGHVTDEETGARVPDAWVQYCSSSCLGMKTDANGFYRFDKVHVGDDGATARWMSGTAKLAGYHDGGAYGLVQANKTTRFDMKLLRQRKGALRVKVVDSVTGAPIPSAEIRSGYYYCDFLCLYTDRSGEVGRTGLELGPRNAPRQVGLTASADGYWPQSKTAVLEADKTTTVEYKLQPECDPARISGTVVNAETQAPIQGAYVGEGWSSVWTDADGRFVINNIKPSTGNNPRQFWLTASAAGFFSQTKQITIFCGAKIVVDFGSRTSKTGTIVGTVSDGDSGQPLADAFVGTDFGATAKTDAAGNYRLQNVPLGDLNADREWSVIVHPTGYKQKTQRVTAGADREARLDFTFTAANEPPTADGQTVELDEDGDQPISLAGSDPDGDTLTYHVMRWPQHGRLSGRAPNVTYDPDDNYNGTDSFEFLVNDGVANSQHATVELEVRPVNDPPRAVNDSFDGEPGTPLRIPVADLLGNDVEVDSEPLTITSVRANHVGATVALDGDEVVFTPPLGWASQTRVAFFDYTITDAAGATSTAWVYIRVDHGPAAPRCVDRAFESRRDQTLTGKLACTDKNGDPLTYSIVSAPADGALQIAADGAFAYIPPAGFLGKTTFTFKATDGTLESTAATVTVDVRRDNDPPVCRDVSADGTEDAPVEIALDCDDADDDVLAYEVVGQPAHGTLEPQGAASYRYTPAAEWSGTDSFTFRAADGHGQSTPATAQIVVRPENDGPVASDAEIALAEDAGPVVVDLASHAADRETADDALDYEIVSEPEKGTLTGSGARRSYVADADANGPDRITYRVHDRGDPDGCVPGPDCSASRSSEIATIRLSIEPRNDLPVCRDVSLTTEQRKAAEIEADCSDRDGDTLTYEVTGQGTKGVADVIGDRLRFMPSAREHGEDTFEYAARDGEGLSEPARVAVAIERRNQPPVAADDTVETDEDAAVRIAGERLTANDEDADGDELTVTEVTAPQHGRVELAAGTVTFTPEDDFHGTARFTYTVADPDGASATGNVLIGVRPINDAPVARDREARVDEDDRLELQLDATDVDDERLEFGVTDRPSHGTVTCSSSGACVYTPAADFNGLDTFAYRVDDGHAGGADTATVTIRVAPVNDRPVAHAGGPYTADEGGSTGLDGARSSDRDGDSLRYAWDLDGDGAHESPGATPQFSAAALDNGVYDVELKTCDPSGACDVDRAVVNVHNVAPTVDAGVDRRVYRNEPVSLEGSWSDPAKALDEPYAWSWDVPGSPSAGVAAYGTPLARTATFATEGVYTARLGVSDDDGASGRDDVVITVLNHNPSCAAAKPSKAKLWPPDHKFVPITISGVTDAEGDTLKLTVTAIRQDEPLNANGDGTTDPDGKGVGSATAEVRAERAGTKQAPGDGRVYHIAFRATDGHGGECTGTVTVAVPHDQKTAAVDGGPLYDSTKP